MSALRYTRPNQFPPVVKNLLIINILVFVAQMTLGQEFDFAARFAIHDVRSMYFQPYQVLTYMFLHGDFMHILFNMFAVFMFGSTLENYWGSKRFLIYYLATGLGAALLHLVVLYVELTPLYEQIAAMPMELQYAKLTHPESLVNVGTLGASGAVFGCLAAFGYLFPNTEILLYFAIPIKAKWFVLIYGALELYLGVRNAAGDNVAHFAHLGGALTGIIMVLIWNKTNRRTLY